MNLFGKQAGVLNITPLKKQINIYVVVEFLKMPQFTITLNFQSVSINFESDL
jgi:hypothetical protein